MIHRGLLSTAVRFASQKSFQPALAKPLGVGALRSFAGGGHPRAHLLVDGTRPEREDAEDYHDADALAHRPKYDLIEERGQKWIRGKDIRPFTELWPAVDQKTWKPMWPRQRLNTWGNYKLLMKAEYCFFYIPTLIIFGLVMPAFACIYALEESIYTTMTVKVTGRQWYWVYEVECPTGDDDDEEDDE